MHLVVKVDIMVSVNCIKFRRLRDFKNRLETVNVLVKLSVIHPVAFVKDVAKDQYDIRLEQLNRCLKGSKNSFEKRHRLNKRANETFSSATLDAACQMDDLGTAPACGCQLV